MALLKHKDYDGEYPVKLAFDLRFRRDEPQDGVERFGAEVAILLGDASLPTFQRLQATLLDLSLDDILALLRDTQAMLQDGKEAFTWSPEEPEIVLEIATGAPVKEEDDQGGPEMRMGKLEEEASRRYRVQLLVDCWAFGVGGSFSGDGVGMEMELNMRSLQDFHDELEGELRLLGI